MSAEIVPGQSAHFFPVVSKYWGIMVNNGPITPLVLQGLQVFLSSLTSPMHSKH